MRIDQRERLLALAEKLADLVLDEADPDNWSGEGKTLKAQSQLERGDRYWCKKNAAASLALLVRVGGLLEVRDGERQPSGRTDDDAKLDNAIDRAERAAANALERISRKKPSNAPPSGSSH